MRSPCVFTAHGTPSFQVVMDDVTLAAILGQADVDYELIDLDSPTRTAAEAADALGVSIRSVVKSLVCVADRTPVLALVPGDRSLALPKLSAATGADHVELARGKAVKDLSGYPIGAVAPIGHPHPLPTYVDTALRDVEIAYFGGGTHRHMLRLAVEDLARITTIRWADLSETPSATDRRGQ